MVHSRLRKSASTHIKPPEKGSRYQMPLFPDSLAGICACDAGTCTPCTVASATPQLAQIHTKVILFSACFWRAPLPACCWPLPQAAPATSMPASTPSLLCLRYTNERRPSVVRLSAGRRGCLAREGELGHEGADAVLAPCLLVAARPWRGAHPHLCRI